VRSVLRVFFAKFCVYQPATNSFPTGNATAGEWRRRWPESSSGSRRVRLEYVNKATMGSFRQALIRRRIPIPFSPPLCRADSAPFLLFQRTKFWGRHPMMCRSFVRRCDPEQHRFAKRHGNLRGDYFSEGAEWDRATVLRLRRVWRDFGRRFPAEGGRLSALFLGSNNRRTPTPVGCDTARVLRPRYRPLEG
jgi:hypothetical protein